MFRVNRRTSWPDNTHLIGKLRIAPAALVAALGKPVTHRKGDVSGEYRITETASRNTFIVYDNGLTAESGWKGLPRKEFWTSHKPADFSIGGTTESKPLLEWLAKKTGGNVLTVREWLDMFGKELESKCTTMTTNV